MPFNPETLAAQTQVDAWKRSSAFNQAHKAMNVSAVSKKPGRVIKRLTKHLDGAFAQPRVLQWDKSLKMVHAYAHGIGALGPSVRDTRGLSEDMDVLFHSDLFLRATKDLTEIDLSTTAAISLEAIQSLSAYKIDEDEEPLITAAIDKARLVQATLPAAEALPDTVLEWLLPFDEDTAMLTFLLPVDREDCETQVTGHLLLILDFVPLEELGAEDRAHVAKLSAAMDPDSFPGQDEFRALILETA